MNRYIIEIVQPDNVSLFKADGGEIGKRSAIYFDLRMIDRPGMDSQSAIDAFLKKWGKRIEWRIVKPTGEKSADGALIFENVAATDADKRKAAQEMFSDVDDKFEEIEWVERFLLWAIVGQINA